MAEGKGLREVAWLDCAGGGQVVLDGDRAYIGHIDAPHGTSVVDVPVVQGGDRRAVNSSADEIGCAAECLNVELLDRHRAYEASVSRSLSVATSFDSSFLSSCSRKSASYARALPR